MSPRLSFQQQQQQNPQTAMHMNTLSAPFSSTPISASTDGQGVRLGDYRGSLQHYHSVHHQVGYHSNNVVASSFAANRPRNHETNCSHQLNGEANSSISNDSMDMPMHADSPVHAQPFWISLCLCNLCLSLLFFSSGLDLFVLRYRKL